MMSQNNKSHAVYFFLPSKGKSFSVGLACDGTQIEQLVFVFTAGEGAADV